MANQTHPRQQQDCGHRLRQQHDNESIPKDHVFTVHPAFEVTYANQLSFLSLGLQHESIGSQIFNAIARLPCYQHINGMETSQYPQESREMSFQVDELERIQHHGVHGIDFTARPTQKIHIAKYADQRIQRIVHCYSCLKDALFFQGVMHIENAAEGHQTSRISRNISRLLETPQHHLGFLNIIGSMLPYDMIRRIPGRIEGVRVVSQFRYLVMTGIYWAGLKACNKLTLEDILPFMIVNEAANPDNPIYHSITVGETRLVTLRKSRSCPTLIDVPTDKRIRQWILKHMGGFWNYEGTTDEQCKSKLRDFTRCARNYVLMTMLSMFSSTDFMLVDITEYLLNSNPLCMYDMWYKFYNSGQSFNKRQITSYRHKDRFTSRDMALYADYVINYNYFTRLLAAYPDIGEFIDCYFHFFRL